jgi:hypothetical protein
MPFLSVSGETFANYLSYDTYNSQWNFNIDKYHLETDPGIFIPNGHWMQQRYKYRCDLVFRPQPYESETFRFCKTDIITECSADWIATEEQEQCNAYTAYVCSGHDIYRNHHCFLCNNVAYLEPCEPAPHKAFGSVPTFSMLLDWKRLKREACASSEIYDPLARVCRKVFL